MRSRLLATVLLLVLGASAARGDAQIDAAIRALRSDSSLKVRAQAAIILGQRGAEEAVGALADAARNDSSEAVRLACISALAKIGDPAGRGAIEAALKDRDGRVRSAAQKALEGWPELLPAGPGAMTVSLEFPSGAGDADLRSALRDALERHLRANKFSVVARGQQFVLRPSVLKVDVERQDGRTVISVRASLVAVDGNGRMAAMLEGGARLKAVGTVQGPMVAKYAAKALDAAARTMTEDLADRLR
ncbi:MAG TPA: HEAT repeat domain-containing protein [Anaeromyxobacteraceae bacterium]|nr:HEAT repeat domain-containing protein [Anaeromyxobacteraceae bacterium]